MPAARFRKCIAGVAIAVFVLPAPLGAQRSQAQVNSASARPPWAADSISKLEREFSARLTEPQRARFHRGMQQVISFWRPGDGDAAVFEDLVRTNFAADQAGLDKMFDRFQHLLEQLDGHLVEIGREFRTQLDLDLGPILSYDQLFAAYDPSAHVVDDFFNNKLAFIVLLNFPVTTLEEQLREGKSWSRRQWAEARLAQRFTARVPAEVNLEIARVLSDSEKYIAEYNIWMHHLVNDQGERLFPAGLRLLSHWNLRDEIKADYSDSRNGLAKQRMIQRVMERIVTQTIPAGAINNPGVDWNPWTNQVYPASVKDFDSAPAPPLHLTNAPEPDRRYALLGGNFRALQRADAYSPTAPNFIDRMFNESRQIPEARVQAMLEQVLTSALVPQVAKVIEARLGRRLEPFDIWYNGFRPRRAYTEEQLDALVAKRYPTAQAYKDDIPNLLMKFGFRRERAEYLASHIVVDPARGSGHAWGAAMRSAKVHLRTRIEKTGVNYKGFNIALHEMGHNVEQIFSLYDVDFTLLQGVPNNAFTEALAFVFQAHDFEQLGLAPPDPASAAMKTLNDFWGTYEIAGVALVDTAVWHWMYGHPDATPAQLKDATLRIARDVWNRYYASVFGSKDVALLAVYSHMLSYPLYLPDYPIAHLIAFQVEEQMEKAGSIGPEFERMAKFGRVAPDLWMMHATGSPVGADALLAATQKALATIDAAR